VTLAKVSKKPHLAKKKHLLEEIRECMDKFDNVFVFSTQNMRNSPLKELRSTWDGSRFFLGKNKVMQRALGRNEEESYSVNSYLVAKHLAGPDKGLFFTNKTLEEVKTFFEDYSVLDYARSGFLASETVVIPAGKLDQFSHALEPHLRSLGMPVSLKNGVIELSNDYTICQKDKRLTPEQARLLKLFEIKMSRFLVMLCCHLSEGAYSEYIEP